MDDNRKSSDYSVDVTKPKEQQSTPAPTSTPETKLTQEELQEQRRLEALEKIKSNQSQKVKANARNGVLKKIIIGVLAVLLIALIVALIVFMLIGGNEEEEITHIRLSMQVDNKDMTYVVLESGEVVLKEFNPGDKVDINAYVRNSNDIGGDSINVAKPPPPIFIRFKVYLILDYKYRYDVLKLDYDKNLWYRFDSEKDTGEDDHYYYFKGVLNSQEQQYLFNSITFYGPNITCDDGGKYGQIQIEVESIEADFEFIRNDNAWETYPDGWFDYMQNTYFA